MLEPPPPPAVEPGQAVRPEPLRASGRTGRKAANLSLAQQRAWRQWQASAQRPAGEQPKLDEGPVDAIPSAATVPVAALPGATLEAAVQAPSDSESIGV